MHIKYYEKCALNSIQIKKLIRSCANCACYVFNMAGIILMDFYHGNILKYRFRLILIIIPKYN